MTVETEESGLGGKVLHSKRLGREMAMQYLFRCDCRQELPDMTGWAEFFAELKDCHGLKDNRYARKAREYAEMLFRLVALHREELDGEISKYSKNWDFARLSEVDKNIMRIAVCEMLYMDDVPPIVSIDEAVAVAIDYSGEEAGCFINGLLNAVKNSLKRSPREAKKKEK